MRRKDREVTDRAAMLAVLSRCSCCRVGFCDGEDVYIVPLNFAFVQTGERLAFYFHGAKQGRKMALAEKNPRVGFELDTSHRLKRGESACEYSYLYESVVGEGRLSVVTGRAEKITGLQCLMRKYGGQEAWSFDERALERVAVLRLDVERWSCKSHVE